MDSIGLAALGLIVAVPALFVAVRIWQEPFAGLCLWVILLPVSKSTASLVGFAPDTGPELLQKITLSDPVLLFTAVAAVLNGGRSLRAVAPKGRGVIALLVAFCACGIASGISGSAGPESFLELATYFWLAVSLVLMCRLLGNRAHADRALAAFKSSAVVACLAAVVGTVLLLRGDSDNILVRGGRVTGLFEAPKQVESYMLAIIPFLCTSALSPRTPRSGKLAYWLLAIVAVLGVLTSGSRLGIVLACLAIWVTVLVASPRAAVVSACLVVLTAGSAWHWYESHRDAAPFAVQRALSFLEQDNLELERMSHGRANQLETWVAVFAEHPLLGVGLDQFRNYVPLEVAGGKAQEMHNSYLAVLAEEGMVGALVIFTLLGVVLAASVDFFRRARRMPGTEELENARALLISYVGLLLYGSNQYGLRQRWFWFVIALIVSLPPIYAGARSGARVEKRARVPNARTAMAWSPQSP
jgi:O-antigen ligase